MIRVVSRRIPRMGICDRHPRSAGFTRHPPSNLSRQPALSGNKASLGSFVPLFIRLPQAGRLIWGINGRSDPSGESDRSGGCENPNLTQSPSCRQRDLRTRRTPRRPPPRRVAADY